MKLTNQSVLITGGGSGIGLAFAAALLQRGNRVLICGRNEEKLRAAQHEHPGLEIFPCDITEQRQVEELVHFVEDHFGGLTLLFNNAGMQRELNLLQGAAAWPLIAEEITANLTAHIQLTQRFLPLLTAQPSAIVNITSALAVVPKQSAPVYCAAKAGLHNFTRTLRYQLRQTPTRVFEVMPALVDTPMTAHRQVPGKISADRVVAEALRGMAKGRRSIYIERTRLLMALYRLSPAMAYHILRDE